jgi:hypothetical protein
MTPLATGALAAALMTSLTVGSIRGAESPAPAEQAPSAATADPWSQAFGRTMTADFHDIDLVHILAFIREKHGLNIVVDPTVVAAAPPVTLKAEAMQLRHVLTHLGRQTGTAFTIEHGALSCKPGRKNDPAFVEVVPAAVAPTPTAIDATLDRRLSLDFNATPLADCLPYLRHIAGATFEARPGVRGSITLELVDVPFRDALHWLGKLSDTAFTVEGSTIVATPVQAGQGGFDH